jgi:hypothetical protein
MSSRAVYGFIAAACLSGAVAVGAQSQSAPAIPAAGAQSADSPVVTVIGCVQKETSVLKRNAAAAVEPGMGDEFVLTNSELSTGAPSMDQPPSPTEPPAADPVGTSGSASNFGKVYRVTGDKENDLKAYVGQRVEISGAFKNEADAKTELSTAGTSGRTAGEPTKQNTPEITIAVIKPSTGSCGGAIK